MPQIHYFCLSLEGTFPSCQPGKSLLTFAVQTSKCVDSSGLTSVGQGCTSSTVRTWPLDFLSFFFSFKAEKCLKMFFQLQLPHCPPGSGFLMLCLALQGACPVTLQGLARPPRQIPRPGPARVSKQKAPLCLQTRPEVGAITHDLSWFRGGSSLANLSAGNAGSHSVSDPRCHWMGNLRNGSLIPLSAPLQPSGPVLSLLFDTDLMTQSPDQCFWS